MKNIYNNTEYIDNNKYLDFIQENYLEIYTDKVFKARHQLIEKGYFNDLIDELLKIFQEYKIKDKIILDSGCGEGSILNKLTNNNIVYGIDLSKNAIEQASLLYSEINFAIADINNLPFNSESIDVIINILSPNNYDQFHKVLKNEGLLIKVIPNEMISAAANTYKSNAKERFYNELTTKFEILSQKEIKKDILVAREDQQALTDINPPLWESDENILETNLNLDLTIIVCKKK
ncbi:methyltransferase domain-containing protein [Mycoplasma sp. P36-A1]|uniref:methyltransferase domain-containing protein n=1 Tax=Mycoplasma sp. P36-A1 TaxID=3252900 RepID=UPI003C2DC91C